MGRGHAVKNSKGFSSNFEKWLEKSVPKFPKFIETYHLTYMTIIWSVLIVLGGYLAVGNINWFWFVSLMIFMQYVTDFYDGKIGKHRKTGLIRWGYYMDHFLDYIFLGAIGLAYAFILPESSYILLLFIFVVFGGFMTNSFLFFAATDKFDIHYFKFGPTEARIVFIVINTLIIFFGVRYFAMAIPYVLGISTILLILIVYRTQKKIWKNDEKFKRKKIG